MLDPDEFYILASKEAVQVPPDYAAEMVPFDPLVGEFRVHYAGFFDPGFGYEGAGGRGARAVLEVRSREVPFILEHGQIVGRLVYEKMLARPQQALRPGHRLELPGAGPQAVEALSGLSLAARRSAQPAEFGKLIGDIARGRGRLHLRRQHQIDGQQAQEPLRVLVLALIRELDAPLRVLLKKTGAHFHSTADIPSTGHEEWRACAEQSSILGGEKFTASRFCLASPEFHRSLWS